MWNNSPSFSIADHCGLPKIVAISRFWNARFSFGSLLIASRCRFTSGKSAISFNSRLCINAASVSGSATTSANCLTVCTIGISGSGLTSRTIRPVGSRRTTVLISSNCSTSHTIDDGEL